MKRLYSVIIVLLGILVAGLFVSPTKEVKRTKPIVGILQLMSHPALDQITKGIQDELKTKGYQQGKNIDIQVKNGQNDQSNLKAMSQNFVAEKADVMVGIATPSAMALANETKQLPVVLGAVTDPVSAGLVKNVKRPGGNVTGVSDQAPITEQLKLIKKLTPNVKKIGIMYSSSDDSARSQMKLVKKEASLSEIETEEYSVSNLNDVEQVTQLAAKESDALYIPTDNQLASAMQTIVKITNQQKIPVYPAVDTMVKEGGLASVSINQYKLGRLIGETVVEILQGKRPSDMPIRYMKQGDLVINDKQAQQLGIAIPQSVKDEIRKQAK